MTIEELKAKKAWLELQIEVIEFIAQQAKQTSANPRGNKKARDIITKFWKI